jgi:alpha-tubulin suppressor-like RCC1 family protein
MLVIGTKPEYFNAAWVRNEWSRFLSIMKKDRSRLLIPCYRDMDAYELPEELSIYQSQDMEKFTFMHDITHGVNKILKPEPVAASAAVPVGVAGLSLDNLMKRGHLELEDSEWISAGRYFNEALDLNPEYAPAYIGRLCVELKVKKEEDLKNCKQSFENNSNFKKTLRFADTNYRAMIEKYNQIVKETVRKKQEKIEEEKRRAEEEKRQEQKRHEEQRTKKQDLRIEALMQSLSISSHDCTVGVKKDGSVVAIGGENEHGQRKACNWRHIVQVSAGSHHVVGLNADSRVIAIGWNLYGACDTNEWRNICMVSAGCHFTVGIKLDGTIISVGNNEHGQCNVNNWSDICVISAGYYHTIGMKENGIVVSTGLNSNGQCDISDWRNIVAVAAGNYHTVGLKSNGTVIAKGKNKSGQCNIGNWRDIIAIAAGQDLTVGLKEDGTVLAIGDNTHGECNVGDWRDIIAIAAGYLTVGLKSNGTVVAVGHNYEGRCNTSSWQNIGFPDLDQLRKQMVEDRRKWEQQGLCINCGGQIGGIFTRKCRYCDKVY